jgi:hypothetical protein
MQPGIQLYSATLTTSGSQVGTFVYCGNVNAVDLYVACSGASVHGVVNVRWALDSAGVTTLPQINQYIVNNTTTPAITDCLPVLAPWVKIDVFSLDGLSATFAALITSALQTVRGTTTLLNSGVCISTIASLAHNTVQNAYGLYVSPGLYSYTIAAQNTVTSTTVTLQAYNPSVSNWDILVQTFNPTSTAVIQGQVVIGTAQPYFNLNNGNASTTWLVNAYLTGPQV